MKLTKKNIRHSRKNKKQAHGGQSGRNSLVFIYCVYPSKAEARSTARLLLEMKLIFCANISAPISSEYIWKGKVSQGTEYAVFFKTFKRKSKKCRNEIESRHSYDVPFVAEIKIEEINSRYLQYVNQELSKT